MATESSLAEPCTADVLPVLSRNLSTLLDRCNLLLGAQTGGEGPQDCLMQCKQQCTLLAAAIAEADSDTRRLYSWLQTFSKAVFDLTFYEESQLVECNFGLGEGAVASAAQHCASMKDVMERLNGLPLLVSQLFGDGGTLTQVLGEEIVECLHWRRGALLYMYCSCLVSEDTQRQRHDPPSQPHDPQSQSHEHCLLEHAPGGVRFLQEMLRCRNPVAEPREDVSCGDDVTYKLLAAGMFSDTHVLALMYSGELCCWFLEYSGRRLSPHNRTDAGFDALSTGKKCLQLYIDVVKGPLKLQGWDCSKAEQLISTLNKQV